MVMAYCHTGFVRLFRTCRTYAALTDHHGIGREETVFRPTLVVFWHDSYRESGTSRLLPTILEHPQGGAFVKFITVRRLLERRYEA